MDVYGMIIFEKIKQEIMADPLNEVYTKQGIQPLFKTSSDARIVIIGQAPGRKAEESRLAGGKVMTIK